jgi:hypothetical protein
MAADLLALAKKVREVLANKRDGDDLKSLVSAAAYVVLNPRERNEIVRKETLTGMMRDIEKSGYFKPEKFSHIETLLPKVGGYNNDPFSYTDCLSDEEKRALSLPVEYKISREMVECMSEKGLAEEQPQQIIPIIYYMNYFAVSRKYQLIEMRAKGAAKVKLVNMGGDSDCQIVQDRERIFLINEAPVLPLPGCDAVYCRCEFAICEE